MHDKISQGTFNDKLKFAKWYGKYDLACANMATNDSW